MVHFKKQINEELSDWFKNFWEKRHPMSCNGLKSGVISESFPCLSLNLDRFRNVIHTLMKWDCLGIKLTYVFLKVVWDRLGINEYWMITLIENHDIFLKSCLIHIIDEIIGSKKLQSIAKLHIFVLNCDGTKYISYTTNIRK